MSREWPFPRVVAHRGGGTLAPENTIAALRCGLAHGFRAVEFDVMLSQDGVPVLMHDENFGRTVAPGGSVARTDAAALVAMDAGAWFAPEFVGACVPTYAQAFEFCRDNHIWMNIEIKPARGFERVTGRVVAQATAALLAQQRATPQATSQATPLLSSFSVEALRAAAEVAPQLPRGWLTDVIEPDWHARMRELGALALHTNQRHLTAALAAAVKQAGYGVFCYTVNSPERASELLRWGVDGFCTDRIDLIGADFALSHPA